MCGGKADNMAVLFDVKISKSSSLLLNFVYLLCASFLKTQRFSQQLSVDVTAFTAAGFFSLTRGLILGVNIDSLLLFVLGFLLQDF